MDESTTYITFGVREYYWYEYATDWESNFVDFFRAWGGSDFDSAIALTKFDGNPRRVQFVFTLAGNYSLEGDTATVGEGTQSNPYKIK